MIGRIMQVEFEAFAKAARSLDQTQSPDQLKANLESLKRHLNNWQQAKAKLGAQGTASQPSGSGLSDSEQARLAELRAKLGK